MNKNQKMILVIFIPIIFFFIALAITNSLGYTVITKTIPEGSYLRKYQGPTTTVYEGNPFDWENTWYVWMLYLIFCCIFEYTLFADKKENK